MLKLHIQGREGYITDAFLSPVDLPVDRSPTVVAKDQLRQPPMPSLPANEEQNSQFRLTNNRPANKPEKSGGGTT